MSADVVCQPNVPTTLVRNIAARGRTRSFVLRVGQSVPGEVVVRSGPLPFFIGATRRTYLIVDGVEVRRGFFDASFEVVVTATEAVRVRLD